MDPETALQEITRANNHHADEPDGFDVDRESYNRTLNEVADIGETEQLSALTERIVQDITVTGERPRPQDVRQHAVDIFERHGVAIPDSSTLSPEDSTGTDPELGGDYF